MSKLPLFIDLLGLELVKFGLNQFNSSDQFNNQSSLLNMITVIIILCK